VHNFIRDADEAGCDAIVCAPTEASGVRLNLDDPDAVTLICPGVRPKWAATNDQKRITTPLEAVQNDADYLVIGRPITQPPEDLEPAEAAQRIVEELSGL
jgi:orotidine-5'-phosphate decarboxylase